MRAFAMTAAVWLAAIQCAGCARSAPPSFDGASAFVFLEEQCALGPRYPGSPGHAAIQRYIAGKHNRQFLGFAFAWFSFTFIIRLSDSYSCTISIILHKWRGACLFAFRLNALSRQTNIIDAGKVKGVFNTFMISRLGR